MCKKLLIIVFTWLCAITGMAQNLEIKQNFKISENSSAAIMYHNQFGQYEKPAMDDTFPYAVVRVLLEGNAHEVTEAKKMLGIYTGVLSQGVKATYLDFENEILFLVPSSSGHVELSCGEGCARQIILELPKLQSNAVYVGKVHYTPARIDPTSVPNPKKQIFSFEVNPKNASVEVLVGEKSEYCEIDDDIQSITLNHGTYQYKVSAPRYQTETGIIQVSDSTRTKSVQLLPDYGWLTLSATESNSGASAYVINTQTKERIALGNIPLVSYELDRGEYTLQIFQNKYKDYSKKITILPNQTITESPILEPNFISLILSTDSASEIFVNGESFGKGQWSGTLELGEYAVETRKANHRSSYIPLTLTAAEAAQTITLASPTPICGSLIVSGSPAKAAIYIDNKYVGESPMIVNDLLIGEHELRVEKDNYIMQNEEVFVTPNAELRFDYILENKPLIPFPNTRTKVGDLYYQAVGDGHSVQVVSKSSHLPFNESFSIPVVEIPAQITYNGSIYSVTSIGNIAFIGCDTLTTVTIPQTVKSIGNGAFRGCKKLASVNIPNSVTSIGNGAFRGCKKLASINIPNSVTTIGDEAFLGCDSLKSIWIPNSVTNIGIGVFANCSQLTSLVVDKSNSRYDSRNNCQAIIETKTNKLIAGCQNTTFPNSVTSIGDEAFWGCEKLASINIPNSVTTIGDEAFFGCDSLKSIWIPNSVTNIGIGVFANCSQLTSLVVDKSNSRYDSRNNCQAIIETKTNKLIAGCQNTTFPNSVTSIGNAAFWGCENLQSIKIPNSVTSIGDSAFLACDNLQSIKIPNSVTSIGNEAFGGCDNLRSIKIPNSVTSIGNAAFWGCDLHSIKIPNSVTSIGNEAFWGCEKLASINIPNSVTSIGNEAFWGCDNLRSIKIPNSVTTIGEDAFYFCDNLRSIKIPNSVTSIGRNALCSCDKLKLVKTPSDVSCTESPVFSFCKNLQHIIISNGNLKEELFILCDSIKSVKLLDGVTGIGDEAFHCFENLTSISIPNSVTHIGNEAFSYCTKLTSLSIPKSVKSIGNEAFKGCDNLKSIKISNGVKSIGNGAFWSCDNLKSIKIPKSVKSIGNEAFWSCDNLKSIKIPKSVKSIGNEAFWYCNNLKSIKIPKSVTSIGKDAFDACYNLQTIYIPRGTKAKFAAMEGLKGHVGKLMER